MGQHRASSVGRARLRAGAAGVVAVLVCGLLLFDLGGEDEPSGVTDRAGADLTGATDDMSDSEQASPESAPPPQKIRKGEILMRIPEPKGPVLLDPSEGRSGTGLVIGAIPEIEAPVGPPMTGTVTTSVANLPNRTSNGGFAASIRTLTSSGADFVTLNEVSRRSLEGIEALAPGYGAYRDPQPDRSAGGVQSMNNVIMWNTAKWWLVDGGRIKVVDNDSGLLHGHRFLWDRYATWAMFQREDGSIISVISTHMPTNPGKYPKSWTGSRVAKYANGMDVIRATVQVLSQHGPVLLGGDMNSHHSQGAWTAAGKMTAAGFDYVKDRGVMHLFFQDGVQVVSHRQVGVASDHPAIITTLDMNGQGPS